MSRVAKLKACLPYILVLAGAAVLWGLTHTITYAAQPGQIGPTFWPRMAILMMAVAALVEIVRNLLLSSAVDHVQGIGTALGEEGHVEEASVAEPRFPLLLVGGFALTLGFAAAITTLGFLLSTFLYLVAFMYLGRYRDHMVIWSSAIIGTLIFAFIFLKLVYVSLPRGTPPFDSFTQSVVDLMSLI